jgi:DNA-binding response OmpR family regulator
MRILIVDDDKVIHEILKKALTPEGHEVECAYDTTDALNIFIARQDIELVITDIVMPNEDGTKLIKHLKNMKPDLPVMAMTGGIENAIDDYVAFASLYSDFTLSKPFTKSELMEGIETAIFRSLKTEEEGTTDDDIFDNLQNLLEEYSTPSTS